MVADVRGKVEAVVLSEQREGVAWAILWPHDSPDVKRVTEEVKTWEKK